VGVRVCLIFEFGVSSRKQRRRRFLRGGAHLGVGSFAPAGGLLVSGSTYGLRRGLHSCAAPRLFVETCASL